MRLFGVPSAALATHLLGSPRAAKVVKKVDEMRAWNQPWHPEEPECYRRVPETSKMEPTWSQNGVKVITNIARETYVFNSPLAQIAHSGLLEGRATSCREAPPHNAYVLNYMYIGKVFCSRIRLQLNHVLSWHAYSGRNKRRGKAKGDTIYIYIHIYSIAFRLAPSLVTPAIGMP